MQALSTLVLIMELQLHVLIYFDRLRHANTTKTNCITFHTVDPETLILNKIYVSYLKKNISNFIFY